LIYIDAYHEGGRLLKVQSEVRSSRLVTSPLPTTGP
jgi:hypothetical protein